MIIFIGSQSYKGVHASCFVKRHNTKKIVSTSFGYREFNLDKLNKEKIIEWFMGGMDTMKTPEILGPQIVWRKSYGWF